MRNTHITVVLDESASMGPVRGSTISGFNEWRESIAKETPEAKVTLVAFNSDRTHSIFTGEVVSSMRNLSSFDYAPAGMTPLYDAVKQAIRDTQRDLPTDTDVMMVVLTDGQENSSYTPRSEIAELINSLKNEGWLFTFLGSNQDAWVEGSKMNLDKFSTRTYDALHPDSAFRASTSAYMNTNSVRSLTGTTLGAAAASYAATGADIFEPKVEDNS